MPFSPSRLRGHREGQRLEFHQLAEISGLTPGRIEEIERGQSTPPTDYETKCLMQALDLAPSELRAQRPTPWGDYCHAVLTYAPRLTPEEIESVASVIRNIRARRRAEQAAEGAA
jgi:transcriptional regulator with XRE-family HTH domain